MTAEDESSFSALALAVGALTLVWGLSETMLEVTVSRVYRQYGGNKVERKIPKGLDREIAFMRKSARMLPLLRPMREEILSVMDEFSRLSVTRHDIVHGALQNIHITDGIASFTRLKLAEDRHHISTAKFDLNNYEKHFDDFLKLHASINSLCERVTEDAPK